MKKFYLLLVALLFTCAGAMNAATYINLVGDFNGWIDNGKEYKGQAVTFTESLGKSGFKIKVWDGIDHWYSIGSGVNIGQEYTITNDNSTNMTVNGANDGERFNVTVNLVDGGVTMKITREGGEVVVSYEIHTQVYGVESWKSYPMTENPDGTWTLDKPENLVPGTLGIKKMENGTQKAWINADGVSNITGAGTFATKMGGSNFESHITGFPAKFIYDPANSTLKVETEFAASTFEHNKLTMYFQNTEGWTSINCYAWGEGDTGWPGAEMSNIEGTDIWTVTFTDKNYTSCIFNNGGSQTGDLTAKHGHLYHFDGSDIAYQPEAHAATQVVVEGESIEVDHAAGTITGKVAKAEGAENAEFIVKFSAAEGHVIMYRHITSGGAQNTVAAGIHGHTVAADGESLTLPVGEGNISVATFDTNTGMVHQPVVYSYAVSEDTSGVESIEVDAAAEAVYYNLQGVRVANPACGVYIRVVNGTATKVRL